MEALGFGFGGNLVRGFGTGGFFSSVLGSSIRIFAPTSVSGIWNEVYFLALLILTKLSDEIYTKWFVYVLEQVQFYTFQLILFGKIFQNLLLFNDFKIFFYMHQYNRYVFLTLKIFLFQSSVKSIIIVWYVNFRVKIGT